MKRLFLIILLSAVVFGSYAVEPFTVKLYPEGASESTYVTEPETNENNRLRFVTDPRMEIYLPEGEKTGQFVVICPGGGYSHITVVSEGRDVAAWLNERGIAAGVLIYRTPNGHSDATIKDVLHAIELVRENAEEWNVDKGKVGVMGFSAGGHLASMAVTKFTSENDKPDFGILIYPVITMNMDKTHLGSRLSLLGKVDDEVADQYSAEKIVKSSTPECFIALCDDDRAVPSYNGASFYMALKEAGVKGELHIYPKGGHGWGFSGNTFPEREEFYMSLSRWLENINEPETNDFGFRGRPGAPEGRK